MKPPGWYISGPNKSLKTAHIGPDVLAVLDGCLLGDGSYIQRSIHTASFSINQCMAHSEWVESLNTFLETNGIDNTVKPGVFRRNGREFPYVKMWTHSFIDLLPQRKRWYPEGRKMVPADLDLSNSSTLAQWHMGDGNASIQRGRLEIKLFTNGFSEDDVKLLIGKLAVDAGIHGFIIHWRGQPVVTIQHKHAEKFIDMVKPHVVSCFHRKLPVNPWCRPRCVKCNSVIGGTCGEKRYAKYCDSCASPRMQRFRSMSQGTRDLINEKKRQARWKREGMRGEVV